MSDTELRVLALHVAMVCEGPKAVTSEVLEAAEAVYKFLKDAEEAPAERPN